MIPLKDYNPARSFPYVSIVLIVLNIALFAVDQITGHIVPMTYESARGAVTIYQFVGGLTQQYALIPDRAISYPFSWVTIFTSMFLHGNFLHIASNMLYLWIFGNNVEDVLGRFKFLLFYFTCGFVAAITQIFSDPQSLIPMVGASGAIAGVMGAYLVLFPRARILTLVPIFFFFTFFELPALVIIGYWALIQFINASWLGGGEMRDGGIAYYAHIGGFVTGLSWILASGLRKRVKMNWTY
jgi:membrane associated rhomboid family serine protease